MFFGDDWGCVWIWKESWESEGARGVYIGMRAWKLVVVESSTSLLRSSELLFGSLWQAHHRLTIRAGVTGKRHRLVSLTVRLQIGHKDTVWMCIAYSLSCSPWWVEDLVWFRGRSDSVAEAAKPPKPEAGEWSSSQQTCCEGILKHSYRSILTTTYLAGLILSTDEERLCIGFQICNFQRPFRYASNPPNPVPQIHMGRPVLPPCLGYGRYEQMA